MYYSEDVIEEVRSRNDIVDVIGGYVSLQNKSNSYMCCCPFHHEKTPSFHVSRDKQLYHCFGCHKSGNVFTFVMEYENYSFSEAVKMLADRCGYQLPEVQVSQEERRKENYKMRLKEANKIAAAYFHYLLTETDRGVAGRKYLEERGFTKETINKFAMGYADIYKDDLHRYLTQRGFSDREMKDAGLVDFYENGGARDKFYSRVMVPILDINNKYIGFGGRILGEGEPKYLNTKETEIFNKRMNLFALNIARRSKRRGMIVCEGYMDVIAMHQAGFDNAVASLGTAFTINQANLLKRYTEEIYLAYDSDGAGTAASLKNIALLRQVGIIARVINLKPYKDPDEFIHNEGAEAYEERIKNAVTGMEFEMETLAGRYNLKDPEEKVKYANAIAKNLSQIDDPMTRTSYIDIFAERYGFDKKEFKNKVVQYGTITLKQTEQDIEKEARVREKVAEKQIDNNESQRILLTWLVNDLKLFSILDGIIDVDDFTDGDYRAVAEKLFDQYRTTGKVVPAAIVNMFDDVDKQKLVGNILQTELPENITMEEKEKAINEVVKSVKEDSLEYQLENCGDDSGKMQEIILKMEDVNQLQIRL